MKCILCESVNEAKNKYCFECGAELKEAVEEQAPPVTSFLFGKEVDILFFAEPFTEKINGIVNPSPEQKMRYRKDGIVQRIIIESPHSSDDTFSAVMAFIRQSKDYLGEEFHEVHYHNHSLSDLKKEYLKLFERVLKIKEKRGDLPKSGTDPKSEKK